jgi:hypothetical protein
MDGPYFTTSLILFNAVATLLSNQGKPMTLACDSATCKNHSTLWVNSTGSVRGRKGRTKSLVSENPEGDGN